jgi:hypothetical protein
VPKKRKGAGGGKKKKFGSDAESSGDEWGSAAKVKFHGYLVGMRTSFR